GLVHVSALSSTFVKDPHDVVAPGDIVKVKVLDVDMARKRIGLTMRLDDRHENKAGERPARDGKPQHARGKGRAQKGGNKRGEQKPQDGTMAALFAKAQEEARKKGRL
ncbi:MAG: S1 RNA-binding domain-containing protein, partial [Alcanivoracaceae bacterium]